IESEIEHLEKKKFRNTQLHSQANWALKGETISKYWSKINSPKKPRDIIYSLKRPNSTRLANRSDEMAEIAKRYHETLQKDNLPHEIEDIRYTTRQKYMSDIPNDQKMNNENSPLYNLLQEKHIHEALFSSKSGSAA
ncbi:hypothetical protein P692DRAFT_20684576, partial [Suillus brevipes Sb2]